MKLVKINIETHNSIANNIFDYCLIDKSEFNANRDFIKSLVNEQELEFLKKHCSFSVRSLNQISLKQADSHYVDVEIEVPYYIADNIYDYALVLKCDIDHYVNTIKSFFNDDVCGRINDQYNFHYTLLVPNEEKEVA